MIRSPKERVGTGITCKGPGVRGEYEENWKRVSVTGAERAKKTPDRKGQAGAGPSRSLLSVECQG